jgi:hypothetical protein
MGTPRNHKVIVRMNRSNDPVNLEHLKVLQANVARLRLALLEEAHGTEARVAVPCRRRPVTIQLLLNLETKKKEKEKKQGNKKKQKSRDEKRK